MPACASEVLPSQWSPTTQPRLWDRARAGSSSSSSSSTSSESSGSSRPGSPADWTPYSEPKSLLSRLLGWYPALVVRLARQLLSIVMFLAWTQIVLSAGLWILDCMLYMPLKIVKWMLASVYGSQGHGKTVLITGSSIETLQLARNFYQSGARVIVIDHDDKYGLVRFSTSIDKFYKVPSPQKQIQEYIRELCRIAERESASYFIPTSTSHPIYFDTLVKPYLEQLNVKCLCPSVKDVTLLEDPSSLLTFCREAGINTPVHFRITSQEQLTSLYEEGQLKRARHVLYNAGPISLRESQIELDLPQTRRGFRRLIHAQPKSLVNLNISNPALIVQIPEGERLITCTTLREGKVVTNVTCKAPLPGELYPVLIPTTENEHINIWLDKFVSSLPSNRIFSGHVSFTLILTRNGIIPIHCRFGVSLPYLCYTNQQPRFLMRPCKHNHLFHYSLNNINNKSVVLSNGCYWLHDVLSKFILSPSLYKIFQFLIFIIRKREVLFNVWDPVPFIVFYCLQLPAYYIVKLLYRPPKVNNEISTTFVHFSTSSEHKNGLTTSVSNQDINGVYKNGYKIENGLIPRRTNGSISTGNCSILHGNGSISNGNGSTSNGKGYMNGSNNNAFVPSGNLIQF